MLMPKPRNIACSSAWTPRVAQRRLVEDRQVPDVQVDRPQREGDQRMGEHAQAIEEADAQDRRDQRAGEAEHDQQRRDVAEQQVLDHVHVQQFLAGAAERGERQRRSRRSPRRSRPGASRARDGGLDGERAHAPGVEQAEERQRPELEDGCDVGRDGERRREQRSVSVRQRGALSAARWRRSRASPLHRLPRA